MIGLKPHQNYEIEVDDEEMNEFETDLAGTLQIAVPKEMESGVRILATGLILQELLQGFLGPKAKQQIIERFAAFPLLNPDREDHIAAAELRELQLAVGHFCAQVDGAAQGRKLISKLPIPRHTFFKQTVFESQFGHDLL